MEDFFLFGVVTPVEAHMILSDLTGRKRGITQVMLER